MVVDWLVNLITWLPAESLNIRYEHLINNTTNKKKNAFSVRSHKL